MFNEIPYQKTEGTNATLTIILGMTPKVLPRESEQAEAALEILTSGLSFDEQTEALTNLLNPAQVVADKVDDARITVEYNRVLFDGENLPTSLSSKLLSIVRDGLDITPWKRFVIRLFSNPSRGAQAELN